MTQPGYAHRITFLLDTRVSLESLVLNRLHRLPEIRREEWLRGLLILGFRMECQAIKTQQSETATPHAEPRCQTTFSHWLTQGATEKPEIIPVDQTPVACLTGDIAHSKPFAALSKVIG
jgi:hypothetical protein